jgi:hypothetical protein
MRPGGFWPTGLEECQPPCDPGARRFVLWAGKDQLMRVCARQLILVVYLSPSVAKICLSMGQERPEAAVEKMTAEG